MSLCKPVLQSTKLQYIDNSGFLQQLRSPAVIQDRSLPEYHTLPAYNIYNTNCYLHTTKNKIDWTSFKPTLEQEKIVNSCCPRPKTLVGNDFVIINKDYCRKISTLVKTQRASLSYRHKSTSTREL